VPIVRRSRFRRSPKRKSQWEWAQISDRGDYLVGTSGGYDGGLVQVWARPPAGTVDTTYPQVFRWAADVTLVKLRAILNIRHGVVPADTQNMWPMFFNIGVIRYPGLSDIPPLDYVDPSDGSWDWIWKYPVGAVFKSAAGPIGQVESLVSVKSKRKIDQNEGLLVCAGFSSPDETIIGTTITDTCWVLDLRWLVLRA